jgi:hypothetical protein
MRQFHANFAVLANMRTPDEVYAGKNLTEAELCRVGDPMITNVSVKRNHFGGDHHLSVLEIRWMRFAMRSA